MDSRSAWRRFHSGILLRRIFPKGKTDLSQPLPILLLLLYAANNLPYGAERVITNNMKERNSLSSYRFVAVMFARFFVQVFMLHIIESAGGGVRKKQGNAGGNDLARRSAPSCVDHLFTTKERVIPKPEQKSHLAEDLRDIGPGAFCPWSDYSYLTTLVFITLAMKVAPMYIISTTMLIQTSLANFSARFSPARQMLNSTSGG